MSVWCNACGRLSLDHEFCDHCNVDLGKSGQALPPERCPVGSEGVVLGADQRLALAFPEAYLLLPADGRSWRVHWLASKDWRERGSVLEARVNLHAEALSPGSLIEDSEGCWAVFEAGAAEPPPWKTPSLADPFQELQRLSQYVHSLAYALDSLHQHDLVWLRFDPGALEDWGPRAGEESGSAPLVHLSTDGPGRRRLRITNLDVELFPFREMPERVRVHPQYAAPEIVQFRSEEIGPRTDVFHLALFTYYWLANKLPDGIAGEGLEPFDFEIPFLRIFAPRLPIGILPVIRRGVSFAPKDRQATPRAFAKELEASVQHARLREAFAHRVSWDIGGQTRTGKAKDESQRINEDAILIKDFEQAALVAVADGVSTCDIGSGALASMMTMIVLENAFADGCEHLTFREIVSSATRRGSEGLLEWAIARGCKADLEAGKDLMGTTVTVGWLQGRELSIANLGDSRAYLIAAGDIEQLTVDGDLASDLLAQGASPAEIRELGSMARALRECVGGCIRTPAGKLAILPESAHPKTNRWPLIPGDVVVLCSDGLVDEGYFLEPRHVLDIVTRFAKESAAELSLRLVEAADAMQRLPSLMEPDGFGDNVSCVVIKIV